MTARRWKRGCNLPATPLMLALLHSEQSSDSSILAWIKLAAQQKGCLGVSRGGMADLRERCTGSPCSLRHQLSALPVGKPQPRKPALAHADMSALEEQPTVDQWDVRIVNE